MARDHKLLKVFLRCMLPIFALGGFGGLWSLFLIGMNQTKTVTSVWSQDKHYSATVVQSSTFKGCGRMQSSYVVVERRDYLVKTGEFSPFCLDGTADRITLRWNDATTLQIDCKACETSYDREDTNWGRLRFVYDLDKP